jgi:hypothetical protein
MRALTSPRHPSGWSFRRVLPSSHAPPLSNLLPPTTPTVTPRPPCPGLRVAPEMSVPGLTSPFTRRLVNRERRIVFTCVAVDWILITLLPTPPRDDAVTLELSTFFMVCVVLGLPPSGVVLLDGARALRLDSAFLPDSSRANKKAQSSLSTPKRHLPSLHIVLLSGKVAVWPCTVDNDRLPQYLRL